MVTLCMVVIIERMHVLRYKDTVFLHGCSKIDAKKHKFGQRTAPNRPHFFVVLVGSGMENRGCEKEVMSVNSGKCRYLFITLPKTVFTP